MKPVYQRAICFLSVVFVMLLIMSLLPPIASGANPFQMARENARAAACLSNVKQLNVAMMMYSADYDNKLPISSRWNESLDPYTRNTKIYICPSVPKKRPVKGSKPAPKYSNACYAMNKQLSRFSINKMADPSRIVLIFESVPGKDQNGGSKLLPVPPRHMNGYSIGYADGHAKMQSKATVSTLKWSPK